eukprot:989686-Pelagomonas_calceolata.AAC.1
MEPIMYNSLGKDFQVGHVFVGTCLQAGRLCARLQGVDSDLQRVTLRGGPLQDKILHVSKAVTSFFAETTSRA